MLVRESGSSGVWKTKRAQIICSHVVPVLDRALMTMSPSRNGNPIHRELSSSGEEYWIGTSGTAED